MSQGIYINIVFNEGVCASDVLRDMLTGAFKGFFCPHTALMLSVIGSQKVKYSREDIEIEAIGGFRQFKNADFDLFANREEFTTPWFRPLIDEIIDRDYSWTTLDLGDCSDMLMEWIDAQNTSSLWKISLFGNLIVKVKSHNKDKGEMMLFRQLVESYSDNINYLSCQCIDTYIALMQIKCGIFPGNTRQIYLSVSSKSDLWLENGSAFRGAARSSSIENTRNLSSRLCEFVTGAHGLIEVVEWNVPEGRLWIEEHERLWESFREIPSIEWG